MLQRAGKIAVPAKSTVSRTPTKRGRGRPKRKATRDGLRAGDLARDSVLERALELTRSEPLSSISMVRLAKSLNVRPGTIHYHLGSRDALVSGVMNRFYRGLLSDLEAAAPAPTWQEEVRRIGWVGLNVRLTYPGVASYVVSHNRFRVFQMTEGGEPDYGALYMDRVFALLRNAGFPPDIAAECWHLMALSADATAQAISMGRAPAAHSKFLLDRAKRYDAATFPGLAFALPALAHLDARNAFSHSLEDLIAGLDQRMAAVESGKDVRQRV